MQNPKVEKCFEPELGKRTIEYDCEKSQIFNR